MSNVTTGKIVGDGSHFFFVADTEAIRRNKTDSTTLVNVCAHNGKTVIDLTDFEQRKKRKKRKKK